MTASVWISRRDRTEQVRMWKGQLCWNENLNEKTRLKWSSCKWCHKSVPKQQVGGNRIKVWYNQVDKKLFSQPQTIPLCKCCCKNYTHPDNQSLPHNAPSVNRWHNNLVQLIHLHSFHTTCPLHPTTAANVNPSIQAPARRDFTLKCTSSHLFINPEKSELKQ